MFRIGLIGTIITALCCFTPLLVWSLGAIGLGSLVAGLDRVLLPLLAAFIILMVVGWFRRRA